MLLTTNPGFLNLKKGVLKKISYFLLKGGEPHFFWALGNFFQLKHRGKKELSFVYNPREINFCKKKKIFFQFNCITRGQKK